MTRKITRAAVASASLLAALAVSAAPAAADPGPNNPKVEYRTFGCDNQNTYTGAFIGIGQTSFLLVDTTNVFVIKVFTEYFPDGSIKTINRGINGFDPSTLITCSYTDPGGVVNVFSGFIAPRT
jgi:hypothetical protein